MSSVKKRDSACNAIKRYLANSQQLETATQEEIQATLELLDQQWTKFCGAQDCVEEACGEEAIGFEQGQRGQAEQWYIKARSNLKRRLTDLEPTKEIPSTIIPGQLEMTSKVKLPTFDLPRFSGDITTWLSFYDSFNAIVHNNDILTGSQKLHYLRCSLSGEPLQLIANFKLQDNNYIQAWCLLKERYHVMRIIRDQHFTAMFAVEKVNTDSASAIKSVIDPIIQNVRALKTLLLPVEHWDDWLIHLIVHKLSHETRRHWELSITDDRAPSLRQLQTFLESRCRSLEVLRTSATKINAKPSAAARPSAAAKPHNSLAHTTSVNESLNMECNFCSKNHKIYNCPKLLGLASIDRLNAVRSINCCTNCLSAKHQANTCRSQFSCKICRKKHHTVLHNIGEEEQSDSGAVLAAEPTSPAVVAHHTGEEADLSEQAAVVMLATALLTAYDSTGRKHTLRALLDNASHSSFITEACVQRLKLSRRHKNMTITGIGCSNVCSTNKEATLVFQPLTGERTFSISALILPKVTGYLPTTEVAPTSWPHVASLCLADPEFHIPARIDLLIGADELPNLLEPGLIIGSPGTPVAQKTVLGWVLFGKIEEPVQHTAFSNVCVNLDLSQIIVKAWELEQFSKKRFLTPEETVCETLFNTTHQRDEEGRFIVELPFKQNPQLGDSREIAIKSWLRMERRLSRNQDHYLQYNAFLQEMLEQGHMELVNDHPVDSYYMPHHSVLKDSSTTTKIRVVFNASQKTTNGMSLNDVLMVGPTLQQDLAGILTRFQTHRFAMIADVAAMYRQIKICAAHTDFQRIIWRKSVTEPLQDYRMLRVTYGVASSAHHAVRALQQTATEETQTHLQAANCIINDFYMDDLLTGAFTEEELDYLQRSITLLLSKGCFQLRKWASNSNLVLRNIPTESKENSVTHLLAEDDNIRALGLLWNTSNDFLHFNIDLPEPPETFTKRSLLSDSCRLFDTTGKLAPVTLIPKLLFQKLWQLDLKWDDLVPKDIASYWLEHRRDLSSLLYLKIPRWLRMGSKNDITDLHCFADASESAYAAAIYARTLHIDGTISVALISAKTKVAPLRTISIPRLELCAASLGADLAAQVLHSLEPLVNETYAWTDSMNTLAWLHSYPSKWNTFIANRVSKVQSIIPSEKWHYVASEHNPADCASRGVSASKLIQHDLWWNGPRWLGQHESSWPKNPSCLSTELELKSLKTLVHTAHITKIGLDIIRRYSSFHRLKRITAYCKRFVHNIKGKQNKGKRLTEPLTPLELQEAETYWIKLSQNEDFNREISCCRGKKPIPRQSRIAQLNPFLDDNGILRIGGRLRHAPVPPSAKFPIILSSKSAICDLLVSDIHENLLHGGPQLMQSTLQTRFWVLGARNLVRKVYRRCLTCLRHSTVRTQQIMANLPSYRVTKARPFFTTGVDMAGPFALKFSKGRGAKTTKGYVAVFICTATGAMHLELAGDLSTQTFIGVLKRFVARRGHCHTYVSDNGTNFVGAQRELKSIYQQAMLDEIFQRYLFDESIDWKFNTPNAPHMGGYWEVAVKRVKFHLKRAIGDVLLTYEEFYTILAEIEACVNSRPLCPLTTCVDQLEALTPGHFLIAEPTKTIPDPNETDFRGGLLNRWQLISQVRNHFWRRWRLEYLVSLQKRAKWLRPQPNLQEGDLVVVRDERAPPSRWKLGRITKCLSGDDGMVRTVELKTADGTFLRPITKVIPVLPTTD